MRTNLCWNFVFNSFIAFKQKLPDSLNKINKLVDYLQCVRKKSTPFNWILSS